MESVPIATLSQDPANARKHDDKNLESIKASLRRFGQQKPIVVDSSNVVRAGNGTLAAATALGWESINVVQTDLQGSEATAYAIADNRTAELAEWDESVLAASLSSLADVDETWLSDLQFSEKELAELVASTQEQEIIEDEVPDLTTDPVTQTGDLWILGEHRLLCGDSTVSMNLKKVLQGKKEKFAVVTDPPYGTGIATEKGLGNSSVPMNLLGDENTNLAEKSFAVWQSLSDQQVWFGANYYSHVLPGKKCWLVWDKDHHGMTYADAELAWTNADSPTRVFRHAWSGMHRASERQTMKQHPTQKPVALFAWIISNHVNYELILDPFLGSGSTLIAAEQLGRTCFGMELSPQYCDVIVERWEKLTGKKARLEGDGATA